MSEKQLENQLVRTLHDGLREPGRLAAVSLAGASLEVRSLADLCESHAFEIFQNDARWNTHKGFMEDVIGGMTPDIVLRSVLSGQNRIYIEVKESDCLHYNTEDSQIIRYFLHLLAVSERNPKGIPDISRAIILAAPSSWFENSRTGTDWKYFIKHYGNLARAFCITLGEWRVDNA
jgi:hypothetical protein